MMATITLTGSLAADGHRRATRGSAARRGGAQRPAAGAATLASSEPLDAAFDRGLPRSADGWVVSGADVLARLDDRLQTGPRVDAVIPPPGRQRGFDRIGDVDVAGHHALRPVRAARRRPRCSR